MDRDELIAKLKVAKEGARELDAAIAVAVYPTKSTDDDLVYAKPTRKDDGCEAGCYWEKSRSGEYLRRADLYTTSIDAALTLVPTGMEWAATTLYGIARVEVGLNVECGGWQAERKDGNVVLALCIAALEASRAP